jgi:hypothetical protein
MKDKVKTVDRRNFLSKVGAGTVAAAATLATPLVTPAQADNESADDKRKARYRVTDDVKAYYRVNRYPK